MFGTAATALLKLMGQSGNVPGAIMAEEVPEALTLLRAGLARISEEASAQEPSPDGYDDEEKEVTIGLDKRAGPLVSLLEAAVEANENVLWNG